MATDEASGNQVSSTDVGSSSSQGDESKLQKSVLKPFTKKNWDAIIDEFEKEEEQHQGVDQLFKQIYEAGNEEVRRAMNKSFQESGGTVLSTNWDNVAQKKVTPKPPSDNDGKQDIDLS